MILIIISLLLFFLGIGIGYFKWDFLIAGYNSMSKEQKEKVDIVGLRKSMSKYLFIIGGITLLSQIFMAYGYRLVSLISLLGIIPITIFLYMSSQKYDGNKDTTSRKMEKGLIIGVLIFVTIIMSGLFIYGSREPKVEVTNGDISIGGIYSNYIKEENIRNITLEDTIPKVVKKVNGFDLGYILRGKFTLENMGNVDLYIHENKPPYILISTEKGHIIINYKNTEKTKALFQRLQR